MKKRIMKSLLKTLSLAMVCFIAGSLLSGCSKKTDDGALKGGGEAAMGETAITSDSRTLLADGNTYAKGLPVLKEKKTFRIARVKNALDSTTDTNDKPIMQELEKETNIHIDWIDIPPGEGQAEQVSILLSTEMPDAFMGLLSTDDVIKDYASFVPLNDLMDQYAPHIKADYDQTDAEAMKILTYPNGKMYSFMSGVWTQHKSWTIGCHFINKKWLDRTGMEVPSSLDDYYRVLKAFKEQDGNGNGDPNDEIPLGFCENEFQARLLQFMGPFGFNDNFRIESGRVYPTSNTPQYRQFLEYYHKLAKEGLLDVEGFSQTAQQFMSKAKQGLYGSFYAWTPDTIIDDPELAAQYVQVLPMTAPGLEGKETVYGTRNRFMGSTAGFTITSACKNPAALVRWYDEMASSVRMKQTARIGEEGRMWEMRDGKVYELQNQGPDFNFQNSCYTYGLMQGSPVLLPAQMASEDPKTSPQNYARDQYVTAVEPWIQDEGILPPRIVSEKATLEKASYEPDLLNFIKSFTAAAIVNGVTAASWDKYVKDLEKYHYGDWIQWQQNYLDQSFS